jgi:hypothetical protein
MVSAWPFIAPRRGCQYTSVAFDHLGLAAFEACAGRRGFPANYFFGPDYLVQLTGAGKVLFRLPLEVGANPGAVLSDPRAGVVLVTEDQGGQSRPAHQFVWRLHGRHLRLIAAYPFSGYIAAQPW